MASVRTHAGRLAPLLPQLETALRRRRGEVPEILKNVGPLGERHIAMLISLSVVGPATVSALASHHGMTVAHASLVVGNLAGVGLVEREADRGDRRRVIVSLSEAAKPALAVMRNRHAPALQRFLTELEDEEIEEFIDKLSRLIACLRDTPMG